MIGNRYELYIYRMIGMTLSYLISYVFRPSRILRTIKSIFTDSSSSVVEQRFKDKLRKSVKFNNYIKPFVIKNFINNRVR